MTDLTNWLFVFVRVSTMLIVFPIFSARNFPPLLRMALAALVAFLVLPTLPPHPTSSLNLRSLVGLFLLEGCVGLLLGFVSRILFYALDLAGGVMATEMGLILSTDFNPLSENQVEGPGLILYFLAALLLMTLDLHHWILIGFQRSYELLPIAAAHLPAALLEDVIRRTSQIFFIAIQMAAPLIAVSFIITIIFSVLGRAVPQMPVFAESFAFRTLGGLIVFGLTINLMAQHITNYLKRLPEDILQVAKLLSLS